MINAFWLEENTSLVKLPDGSSLYQHRQGQKISSDNQFFNDHLIERFSNQNGQVKRVLELGVGNGINVIMLKKKFPDWTITGIEIDSEQAQLASYNCKVQNLGIVIINEDLRDLKNEDNYDLIIANPPYIKMGSGKLSAHERTNIAKFELTCTMEDLILAIKRNLSAAGEAWLLYKQEREEDLRENINQSNLEVTDIMKKGKIIIVGLKHVAS